MNNLVYKFKRYEDASLNYAGMNEFNLNNVGGFDTVITKNELYKYTYTSLGWGWWLCSRNR